MIYLDYAATTPLDPQVRAAMLPWLETDAGFGNPASDHALGRRARKAVEAARAQVAALLGASAEEIIWTSGATESNNLAIKGALEFRGRANAHVISSRIEHKSVLDTLRYLETQGLRVTYLTPAASGVIEPEQVRAALRPDTALVSLMWVNNETGAINPVLELASELRARGVLVHIDAVQAAGKIAVDLAQLPADLLSVSAHKLYGPKGIGALFVRKRPRARLSPQIHGGGHEQGMRSGTLATHQIVGFGAACALAAAQLGEEGDRIRALRERLQRQLQSALPEVLLNAPAAADARAPGILNLSFTGVEGESLRAMLPELMVSSGSACSSATREPSYVLRALGRSDELAGASLRLSLGRYTTAGQVDAAATQIIAAVQFLRELSPQGSGAGTAEPLLKDNVYEYPAPAWQRFAHLKHDGRLPEDAEVLTAEADSAAARSLLRLQLRVHGRQVRETRFQAYGCPIAIAVGEYLAERLEADGLDALGAISAAVLRDALEISEDKAHCALMGEDVLRALLQKTGGKT
ncbi:cysteine desulfurase [Solimonas aquatica]|uniref:cysteine desulfurase n=1 Tax=Solimonas aquatica TaxID=489703 RepID=A0A1H9H6I2_9GAMM|nr:cysteine desulfurase [Solimonas aquatica]